MKDYYQILNIPPTASAEDVKKAFRRLALKYHPDKNQDSISFDESYFKAVKEAYDVLSDRKRRQQYDRLFYAQYERTDMMPAADSIQGLLEKAIGLKTKLANADPFRMNARAVYYEISLLLSPAHFELLNKDSNEEANNAFVELVLQCCNLLPYSLINNICARLLSLHCLTPLAKQMTTAFLEEQKLLYYWVKYKTILALMLAILLCASIYFLGRR